MAALAVVALVVALFLAGAAAALAGLEAVAGAYISKKNDKSNKTRRDKM